MGSRWADVARVILISKQRTIPDFYDPNCVKLLLKQIEDVYLKEYIRFAGKSKEELTCWITLFAASKIEGDTQENIKVWKELISKNL